MGEHSAALTVLLGVGVPGGQIVTRLLSELEEDPGFRARSEATLTALVLEPPAGAVPDEGRVELERIHPAPTTSLVSVPRPAEGTRTEYLFASTLRGSVVGELERMLGATRDAERGRATRVFVDVWLVGSVDDPLFRAALFPLVVTLRHAAAERFEALFRTLGPVVNANFQVHPIGVSGNLKALSQEARQDLVGTLASLERYNSLAYAQAGQRGPGGDIQQPALARFYLVDGFTGSSMLGPEDQHRLAASLLLLALRTGLRHRPQLRELFRFRPGETDLLAVVTLATLEFPVTRYRNYCVLHAVASLIDHVEREPEGSDRHGLLLDQLLGPVLDELDQERLRGRFVEHGSGDAFVELVDRQLPDFVGYTPEADQAESWSARLPASQAILLPEPPTPPDPLYDQGTFLPRIKRRHQPDEMARFFGERWEDHPSTELECRPPSPVPERFRPYLAEVNERGYQLIDELTTRLYDALDRFLQAGSPPGRLAALLRVLERREADLSRTRRSLDERLRSPLPRAPDDSRFRVFTEIFRDRIWARLALPYVLCWAPVLVLVAFFALQHVMPGLGWATDTIPALEVFYTDDPLRADAVRERLPQLGLALLAALLVVLVPMWAANTSVFGQLRSMLRSPLPYLARLRQLRRMQEAAELGPEQDEAEVDLTRVSAEAARLQRKVEKATDRHGVLHRELEGMRDSFRLYWQARVELSADLWSHRVVVHVGDALQEELRRLRELREQLGAHRLAVRNRLRQLGDRHPSDQTSEVQIYPPETPYHALLLDDAAIPLFYDRYRTFASGGEAAEMLLQDEELLSAWRESTGPVSDLEVLLRAAEALFPALTGGPFNLSVFSGQVDGQLAAFLSTLEGRLSGGTHFGGYASAETERDHYVDDSGVVLVAPDVAMRRLQAQASRAGLSQPRLVGGSRDPNRIYAARMVRDIAVATLASYLGLELDAEPLDHEREQEQLRRDPWALVRNLGLSSSGRGDV